MGVGLAEVVGSSETLSSSFRDPSGFLFRRGGELLRQVNRTFKDEFDACESQGLFQALWDRKLLVRHEKVGIQNAANGDAAYVIRPVAIPFISYPHEWCFSALKDAALCTLDCAEVALEKGFVLKDATAYNIQFVGGAPVFIDTLSFERYVEGTPWVAYRQFCQHFLAPLALMAKTDINLGKLLQINIDGVPLELASRVLPWSTRLNLGLLMHIHLHAKSQQKYSNAAGEGRAVKGTVSRTGLRGLFDGLRSAVNALEWKPAGTEWGDYYEATNYTESSMAKKLELVGAFIAKKSPKIVWDLGANTGVFSDLAVSRGAYTMAFDIDPAAVEKNYRRLRQKSSTSMLPLVLDLTNPTPSFGWGEAERDSLRGRGPADIVLALALVHHLAISNNVPLGRIAQYFSSLAKSLVIEFVPKSDSQVRRLLASRKDIFPDYTREGFEREFSRWYSIENATPIEGSERVLYLMERR